MANEAAHLLAKHLLHLSSAARLDHLPDGELLQGFATGRDEDAFAALVRRHGPMVLRVAQRLVHNGHDAEDVFQATFLVLSRKAGSLRRSESVGCFLHGVAYRLSLKARTQFARQRRHEGQIPIERSIKDPLSELTVREAQAILDEELARLPEKYRAPLVLCCLEGNTRDEAARLLGWSAKLVKSRLEQGRERLRYRLSRRGLTLPAALVATLLAEEAAPTALPAVLIRATVQAVRAFPGNDVSASVVLLAESALSGTATVKGKAAIALLLLSSVLAAGLGVVASLQPAAQQAEKPSAAKAPESPKSEKPQLARTDRYGDPLPDGAIARLGTIRFRHDHASLYLMPMFSRDGKMLVTGFNEIRLWDSATGKLLREIRGCPVGKTGPFFTPDGRRLIGLDLEATRKAGHNCSIIRLWDAATGRPLRDIPTDGDALACTPDGKQLVTVAKEGVISFWDIATGKRTTQLRGGHKQQVTDLAFTADGKGLITFCVGHRVCHWNLSNGRLEKSVELMVPRQVHCTCLSSDGQSLAVSPRAHEPVFLLDTTTGKKRVQLQGVLARGGWGLAFSPDGKTLATSQGAPAWADQTEVAFWDAGTGKLLRHFSMPVMAALHLCFAPDGRTLVTAGQQPVFRLWDVATGKQVHNWPAHTQGILALSFTPNGAALISGSRDGSIRLWDAKTGRHLRELQGHPSGIIGLDVTHGGKTIVSCGWSDGIRLQSPEGRGDRPIKIGRPPEEIGPVEQELYPHDTVQAFGLSPDGKTAVTFDHKLKVGLFYHVWDLSTGKAIIERRDPSKVIASRTFSPDMRLVARTVQGDADGPIATSGGGNIALPPGLTRAVVEDVASGKEVAALALPKRASGIVRFTADSRSRLTSSYQSERRDDGWHYDNALHLWELASKRVRQTITWSGRGRFIQAALSPDGRTVATAHDDRTIQLWDLVTGKELLRWNGFSSQVGCLAFSPDGRLLASGHFDGTILVWDVKAVGKWSPPRVNKDEIERLWTDLGGKDGVLAYRARWRLAAAGSSAVAFLAQRLQPMPAVAKERLTRLIADLNSDRFETRELASAELQQLGEQAETALRQALTAKPSLEASRRLRVLLDRVESRTCSVEQLHYLRAVEVLEHIGSSEARQLLRTLAEGAPEAMLTREAKAALERLTRRPRTAP